MPRRNYNKEQVNQLRELQRLTRNYNAKRRRLIKKEPLLKEYVKKMETPTQMMSKISGKVDFNRKVKELQQFTKQKIVPIITEQGIKTTNYEVEQLKKKIQIINRQRKKEQLRTKNATPKTATMGTIQQNELKPMKLKIDKIKEEDFKKFIKSVDKQLRGDYSKEKAINYKNNYLQAMQSFLNSAGVYYKKLYNLINNTNADTLYGAYYNSAELQINFISDPLQSEVISESAYQTWVDYLGGDNVNEN